DLSRETPSFRAGSGRDRLQSSRCPSVKDRTGVVLEGRTTMNVVFRYRVKSLNGLLNRQARTVNFVWNYCNDRQKDALRFGRPWLSGFDLNKLTSGTSKELGLH